MAGIRAELFSRREFSFANVSAGNNVEVVVHDGLDVSQFDECTLEVRVHTGTNATGTSVAKVVLSTYAPSKDDPSNNPSFANVLTSATVNSSTSVPGLVTAGATSNLGDQLQVSVVITKGTNAIFVLSATLSLKMSVAAFQNTVRQHINIAEGFPLETILRSIANSMCYPSAGLPAEARELRRYLALCAVLRIAPERGTNELWNRFFAESREYQKLRGLIGDKSVSQSWTKLREAYIEAFEESPPSHIWGFRDKQNIGSEEWWGTQLVRITSIAAPGTASHPPLTSWINLWEDRVEWPPKKTDPGTNEENQYLDPESIQEVP